MVWRECYKMVIASWKNKQMHALEKVDECWKFQVSALLTLFLFKQTFEHEIKFMEDQ